jgi:tRNA G10  N-methylase Trm11
VEQNYGGHIDQEHLDKYHYELDTLLNCQDKKNMVICCKRLARTCMIMISILQVDGDDIAIQNFKEALTLLLDAAKTSHRDLRSFADNLTHSLYETFDNEDSDPTTVQTPLEPEIDEIVRKITNLLQVVKGESSIEEFQTQLRQGVEEIDEVIENIIEVTKQSFGRDMNQETRDVLTYLEERNGDLFELSRREEGDLQYAKKQVTANCFELARLIKVLVELEG